MLSTRSSFLRLINKTVVAVLLAVGLIAPVAAAELNVYSHRQPFLINPFLKAFEKESGIKVNVVFASKGLVQRLLAEGARSPADVVLTVDIGRLYAYVDKNLFSAVTSEKLSKNIPAHLRDSGNRWFGLSKRARIVAISKDRVKPSEITQIEDLAKPKWKGRVCSRPGSHVYNRALLASVVAAKGEKAAEAWARGLVANLARRPQGNDRAQVKAIYEGVCDVAIINSYYFGKLKTSKIADQRGWAKGIQILFTNQKDRGNHVNISGGGVVKFSKNKKAAVKLLEFLTEQTAQTLYGEINFEFPINPKTESSAEVKSWGAFKEDQLRIEKIAELTPVAQRIIDRVGW
ncbi:MAG: iron ABC transporter substrate-binding protein [Rhodospirillaceae bacterium]|nr:iron ABC transporter substrate-binding protein [Rhodospirillaceae bacterium]|tara:strand:+ start:3191 stop:4228 length:1038 start_codon:yes stop_codon:yes gene_type:complete